VLLRIETLRRRGITTLRVEGQLTADGVDEMQRVCARCRGRLELHLSSLRNVDHVGAAYLQGLVHAGVRVVASNPYLTELLGTPKEGDDR